MLKPHILILGAGFGGMYVARELLKHVKKGEIDVTVVNETNYFLFTPLLHEVATGSLSPNSVAEPLREIFNGTGVHVSQGIVQAIDRERRIVRISSEVRGTVTNRKTTHDIPYDYLVIATGASTNYYGIPGADTHTYPLKTLADAARIRQRVIDSFEEAILCEDPTERARLLSFTVVGGGPTGIEMTAELAELVCGMVTRYYSKTNNLKAEEPTIGIVHIGKQLLEQFAPSLRVAVEKRLHKQGVNLHMGNSVTAVTPQGLLLSNNSTVPTGTVIWCAGVKANIPSFEGQIPEMVAGRLAVDEYFRMKGDERVFALGDMAGYVDPKATPKSTHYHGPAPLPMLAQVAVKQAKIVARNIVASVKQKKLKDFHYNSQGVMVSVGQWFAVGEIYSFDIAGRITWWLWRGVYIFKFFSWKKRIRIVVEWFFDAFYPRDITKI